MKKIALPQIPIFLLNGKVIWQTSDSPLSKEQHVQNIHELHELIGKFVIFTNLPVTSSGFHWNVYGCKNAFVWGFIDIG